MIMIFQLFLICISNVHRVSLISNVHRAAMYDAVHRGKPLQMRYHVRYALSMLCFECLNVSHQQTVLYK